MSKAGTMSAIMETAQLRRVKIKLMSWAIFICAALVAAHVIMTVFRFLQSA